MPPPLILAAQAQDSGASAWEILAAIGVIVGLLAGIQQLTSWLRRRDYTREQDRALKLIRESLDAEQIQRELAKTKAERDALRQQVDEELPREGRRAYLSARVESLGHQLRDDFAELDALRVELEAISGEPQRLDGRLQRAVGAMGTGTQGLRPLRTGGAIAAIAAALLLILFAPRNTLGRWLDPIVNSADASAADVVLAVVVGALLACLLVLLLVRYGLPALHHARPWPWLWSAAIALGVLSAATLVIGTERSNHATALQSASYESFSDSPGLADSLARRAEEVEQWAAVLIGVGTVSAGACAALLLCCMQLRGAPALSRR